MVKMKEIAILGRPIQLQERSNAQMKGVTIGEMLSYKFYDGEFMVCHCYSQNLKIK